ncbi:SIR2 family protein [Clostridium sp.]|uniref:SIR2 family protein n=1 Tax=Clostridium sp. TaxID=1506 RepID=UPI0025C172FC|nr:SIR2 family protein [Clostridium sp.]
MYSENKNTTSNKTLINSLYYFELLVLNAINNKLKEENKSVLNKNIKAGKFLAINAIVPDGIDGLSGQTVVEVRLYKNRNNYFRIDKELIEKLNNSIENSKLPIKSILLVFGDKFTQEEVSILEKIYREKIICQVKVWGLDELCEIDEKFNHFRNGNFSKIVEFLVSDLVSEALNQSDDMWKRVREERINELKRICSRDELVLFLGAGVSKEAGIGDWNDLMSDLLIFMIMKELEEKNIDITSEEKEFLIRKMKETNNKSPLLQSALIKSALGDSFEENLAQLLYKNINSDNGDSSLLNSISKLCLARKSGTGIKAIVTYNFDDLLEYSFNKHGIKYNSLYSELDYSTSDKLGIYHVHGFLPRNPNKYEQLSEGLLVFSEDRYHSLYNDPYSWTNITQLNFLRENTTLMIGLSLTDPNLRRLLSISNRKNKLRKHYAIMRKKDFRISMEDANINENILKSFNNINNELHETAFEQLGINIIWVENYDEISDIIDRIRDI